MIAGGVDVGAETVKVIILNDSKITGYSIIKVGFERRKACDKALELALSKTEVGCQ